MRTTYKPPGVFDLYESFTSRHKQLGVRHKSFHYISDWPSVVPNPTALTDVETKNFGNQHFELRIDTLPFLFTDESFCDERPIVTPTDFRALLEEHEHCIDAIGQASAPPVPLPAGTIRWCDNNVDMFTHKTCIKTIDTQTLPRTITNKETNRFKQVVQVDRILELDTSIPLIPTSTMDVEFTKLGDGTALEIHKTTQNPSTLLPEIFDEKMASAEIPNLIPEIFRAAIPITMEQFIQAGTSINDPPVLPQGALFREEKRETEFTVRITNKGFLGLTYPQNIAAYVKLGGEQFGGEAVAGFAYMDVTPPPLLQGYNILSCDTKTLVPPPNAVYLRLTEQLANSPSYLWPILTDYKFDLETQTHIPITRQVIDATTYSPPANVPYYVENFNQIDKWRGRQTKTHKNVEAINSRANALISYKWHPFHFPGTFDYQRQISFGHREGYRRANAILARHTMRTWWLDSTALGHSPPTVGDPHDGTFDVMVNDIITDTVNIPIYSSSSSVEGQTYPDVLHDTFNNTLGAYYPATRPSLTEYYLGTPSSTTGTFYFAAVNVPGNGYALRASCTINGHGFVVASVGVSNSLVEVTFPGAPTGNYIVTSVVDQGSFAVTGGGGSGAYCEVFQINYAVPVAGSAWVGTERDIAATVTQTEVPGLWKVVLESVVMR
jgi:hypothetical protein